MPPDPPAAPHRSLRAILLLFGIAAAATILIACPRSPAPNSPADGNTRAVVDVREVGRKLTDSEAAAYAGDRACAGRLDDNSELPGRRIVY